MNNCCCQPKMSYYCCQPKMSCCCQPEASCVAVQQYPAVNNVLSGGKNGCSFSCLIILILILLVFSNHGGRGTCGVDGNGGDSFLGGKGIIFIIALFYLSCVSPCGSNNC